MIERNEFAERDPAGNQDARERAGLGLLARFIGAVFLVLLSGLLLLDHALMRANEGEAALDAQATGLLVRSFILAQIVLVDRIAEAVTHEPAIRKTSGIETTIQHILSTSPGSFRVLALDANGRTELDLFGGPVRDSTLDVPLTLRKRDLGAHVGPFVVPAGDHHRARIVLARETRIASPPGIEKVMLVMDASALLNVLDQMRPASRAGVLLISARDTLSYVNRSGKMGRGVAESEYLIQLPEGGVWRVAVTHVLSERLLRWMVWILGVLGSGFLALGLLREQRRAVLATDRSIELERLYSDVKRANQAKSEFLANVSHELRTPLNAIVGFVELLRDGFYGVLSPRQVLPVDRIAASATHLRHLVDQVLDIAKIAAGRLEVHAEAIVLRPFVLNVASELESLISEKDLTFSMTIGASLPRVRTDPTHLRQILINLIGNAVKYTEKGSVGVRARLVGSPDVIAGRQSHATSLDDAWVKALLARAPRSGIWIALQVEDTGIGITPDNLERIFDEFEQVNAGPRGDSMSRGTGLGLAISRRLARLLGGEIGVESELGRGSTFTVWLPVNPADLVRDPARVAPAVRDLPIA